MPRDDAGAPRAPKPLSAFLLRERRLKIASAAARRAARTRRRISKARLEEAEWILNAIIAGGDFLAKISLGKNVYRAAVPAFFCSSR